MKKYLVGLGLITLVLVTLVACGNDENNGSEVEAESIEVLVTFSILADMVENVGGDLVNVTTIVPIGEDPHEHEVTPGDVVDATNADLIFYNGLYLEVEYDWFEELMETAGRVENEDFFAVTDRVAYLNLRTAGMEDYYDPHAWMDPILGMEYIDNIARVLSASFPEHEDYFLANAESFNGEIYAVYNEWSGRFAEVSEDRNLVVTAEGAFQYFGHRFDVGNDFIWEINSEDEGTPEQFIRIINIVNESSIAYLFIESSIDPDYMAQVSEETGVPIFREYLFTDSLSEGGGPASTYLEFLRHNLETIYAALTGE